MSDEPTNERDRIISPSDMPWLTESRRLVNDLIETIQKVQTIDADACAVLGLQSFRLGLMISKFLPEIGQSMLGAIERAYQTTAETPEKRTEAWKALQAEDVRVLRKLDAMGKEHLTLPKPLQRLGQLFGIDPAMIEQMTGEFRDLTDATSEPVPIPDVFVMAEDEYGKLSYTSPRGKHWFIEKILHGDREQTGPIEMDEQSGLAHVKPDYVARIILSAKEAGLSSGIFTEQSKGGIAPPWVDDVAAELGEGAIGPCPNCGVPHRREGDHA